LNSPPGRLRYVREMCRLTRPETIGLESIGLARRRGNGDDFGMETPTRLPEPPRQVRGGVGGAIWFIRLFILPHMAVGICIAGAFVLTVLVAVFGTDSTGSVLELSKSRGRKGGTVYNVRYRYGIGWRCYTNSASVGWPLFSGLSRPNILEGQQVPVKVRHIQFGPLHYHVFTEAHSAWAEAGPMLLFALFWNGIMSIFVYALWIAPLRLRGLVRHGQAVAGQVVTTRVRRGKSTAYYATFRFTDPENGQEIEREMILPGSAQYDQTRAGMPVTVLYDPRKPKRAVAYELCGYRVVAPEGAPLTT
jgi:hypothetical protein